MSYFSREEIGNLEITIHFQEQYYSRAMNENGSKSDVMDNIRRDLLDYDTYIASYDGGNDYGFMVEDKGVFFPIKGDENDRHLRTVLYSDRHEIEKLYEKPEYIDKLLDM
jgi:hypothetical protein